MGVVTDNDGSCFYCICVVEQLAKSTSAAGVNEIKNGFLTTVLMSVVAFSVPLRRITAGEPHHDAAAGDTYDHRRIAQKWQSMVRKQLHLVHAAAAAAAAALAAQNSNSATWAGRRHRRRQPLMVSPPQLSSSAGSSRPRTAAARRRPRPLSRSRCRQWRPWTGCRQAAPCTSR